MYANVRPDENGNWGAIGVKNSTTGNELAVNADGSINVSSSGGGSGAIVSNASDTVATTSTNQATVAYNYGFNGTTWDRLQLDGSKNLKVAIQGTPNVNATISGTPNVAVTSMPTTTVTGSVGITGTPNVNATITGTPSVSVTSMPTTTVTGTVGISGTPAVTATGSVANSSDAVATSSASLGTVAYGYGFNGASWDRLQVDASKNLKVNVQSMPSITGSVSITGTPTVSISSMPTTTVTGSVSITGTPTVSVNSMPTTTVTGNVGITGTPTILQGGVDQTQFKNISYTFSASATGDSTIFDVTNYETIALQVALSATGTFSVQVSMDGTTFVSIQYTSDAGSRGTGVSTAGVFRYSIAGVRYLKFNASVNTGSITITGSASIAKYVMPYPSTIVGSADGQSASAVLMNNGSYGYGYNGTTWDRLQVDASKNLKVIATQGAVDSTSLKSLTFQNAVSATGAVTLDISGYNTVSLDVVITSVASVQFSVSNDNTNFTLIQYQSPQSTTASATNVSATTRALRFNVAGFKYFQSNVSAYTSGTVTVTGFASAGSTPQSLYTLSASGGIVVTPRSGSGNNFAAIGDSQAADAVTGTNVQAAGLMGYNGATYDKMRVGKVYKWFEFILFAAGATQAVWTPTAGKKFRVMGVQISSGGAAFFYLQDATTTFYAVRMGGVDTKDFSFGNGYLSSAANNVLNVYNNTGSQVAVDVVVWGTEE